MRIRRLVNCSEFVAGDHARLRELFHPDRGYPFSGRYSLAHACVAPGQSTKPHRLESSEVYYVISGAGIIRVDDETAAVGQGDAIDIPGGAVQSISNTGPEDLTFLCIVDPAWRAKDERILE